MICPICFNVLESRNSYLSFYDGYVDTTAYECQDYKIHIDKLGRIAYIGINKNNLRVCVLKNHALEIRYENNNLTVPYQPWIPKALHQSIEEAEAFIQRYIKLMAFT